MRADRYDSIHNAPHMGRGRVYFGPALLPTGAVGPGAFGSNWPDAPDLHEGLRMAPGRFVGNGRGLSIQPSVRRLRTLAWDSRPGTVVDGVSASVTLYGHGAANLASALQGQREQRASREMTETIYTANAGLDAGSMLFTRRLIDITKPVTVVPSWTAWTKDLHYGVEAFGLLLKTGMSGPSGSSIAIRYTPEGSTDEIQALSSPVEIGMVYVGQNVVDGLMNRSEIFRAQLDLESGLQMMVDGISTLTLSLVLKPVRSTPNRPAEWFRVTRGRYSSTS